MNILDRARIERAVLSYDWWLDLRGMPWRRRRDLRRELRANLRDAATHRGARAAVTALSSTRQMAAEARPEDRTRPRWAVGLYSGVVTLAVILFAAIIAGLAWTDGVLDAEPDRPVSGSVTFLPGSSMDYAPIRAGFEVSVSVGWLPGAMALLVFAVVARPWRLVTGGRAKRTAVQTST